MGLSLRRNAAWTFLGQVVFAACHWGIFIIVGRLAGPEELGRYALALAVVTPIMMFGGLQMRQLQVVDATHRYHFRDYYAVRLAGTLCAGVVILAIALLGYTWQAALPILVVGFAKGIENLSDVHYGLAQRHKRLDLVAQSVMLRGFLGLMALGTGYYLTENLGAGLMAMAVAWGLVWWLFDRVNTARWRAPSEDEQARKPGFKRRLDLAWTALPLGMALMLVTLNPNVPRYFIEALIGVEALGLFAAMAHFVVAGRMIINAVCQAASPRLADLYATGNRAAFLHLLVRLTGISILPGLAGLLIAIAFGRELLDLVYGPRFTEAAEIFPWIMLVGVVVCAQTPFGYGLTAMHQFKLQPLIFGFSVVVNATVCLMLIPTYDLLGATFGWLAAAMCQFVLSLALHWRSLSRQAATAPAQGGSP
jgi:O-antigen/teichoic acid export membrane protein